MKTYIKKTTDTITIPDNFASLERADNGKYYYRIRFLADPIKAAKQSAFKVRLNVSKKPYRKKTPATFGDLLNSLIIDRLQGMQSERKDAARSSSDDYIITYISDLTARIPNYRAPGLKSSKKQGAFGEGKRVVSKTVADLRSQNLTTPVLDTNTIGDLVVVSDQRSKANSIDLLYTEGTDPAKFSTQKTNTIRTADRGFSGTLSKSSFMLGKELFGQSIAGTLLNKNDSFNTDELSDTDVVGVVEAVQQSVVEITEDIEIPAVSLDDDDDFYIVFELLNDRNYPIQISSNLVSHGKNLRLLRVPTLPPSVIGSTTIRPGRVLFDIRQEDPNAKGVMIYKKLINGTQNSISSDFVYVGKAELTKSDGIKRIEDLEARLGHIIYRFIPYSDEASLGAVFTTTTVKFTKSSSIRNARYLQRPSFVSITGEVRTYGIAVTLQELPYNAIAVTLLRKNLTTKQRTPDVVGQGSVLLDLKGGGAITIDDTSVSPGRVYEYSVQILYRDGATVPGSNTYTIEYSPVVSNIATTTVNQPRLINDANGYDVVFEISLQTLSNNSELVRKLIAEQGLQAEFQNDITANKEKLNKLFSFSVTRDNLTTGEKESFGTIDSPVFSDRKYGVSKNVKPIDPGSNYEYTVVTHFRNPETLFSTLTRTVTTGNKSYTLTPSKWLHPITLNDGNLVSDASIRRNHSKDAFQLGTVADIQKVSVSLANVMPSIASAQVTRVREKANLIQWTISGNPQKVDHYIVILEILGMRTIVGAGHSIGTANYFEFLDVLDNNEKGALTYLIVPVYYDYSKGTETKTNTVII